MSSFTCGKPKMISWVNISVLNFHTNLIEKNKVENIHIVDFDIIINLHVICDPNSNNVHYRPHCF